jgi:hypothetical protein
MWNELPGPVNRVAGVSGTVTIPPGAKVTQIHAAGGSGGGTVQIFNDAAAITLLAGAWWGVQFQHLETVAITGQNTIVFTGTASYWVEYTLAGSQ